MNDFFIIVLPNVSQFLKFWFFQEVLSSTIAYNVAPIPYISDSNFDIHLSLFVGQGTLPCEGIFLLSL